MDQLREFLATIAAKGVARGNLLGLLHVLIGRRLKRADGGLVSAGLSWRETAAVLKQVRWDRQDVTELGLDPAGLPPRDRERYWYAVIARAGVDSPAGIAAGDRLAARLHAIGYEVGPPPGKG
jgi:hypothetical protein